MIKNMIPVFAVLLSFVFGPCIGQSQTEVSDVETRMSPELLWKLGRLGGAVMSPDGSQIAYTVRRYALSENKGMSTLFVKNIATGTETELLPNWPSISSLDWLQTGGGPILFFEGTQPKGENEENDNAVGGNQAWSIFVGDEKPSPLQLTFIDGGISNFKVSSDGTRIAFTLDIKMDQEVSEIYKDLPKADARIIDGLMYRHWNAWHDYKYSHLHVSSLQADGTFGEPIDLMKGIKADCPVPPFGGSEQFNFSPDGTEIAFTMKNVENWAESTNSDVYLVATDGSSTPRNLTEGAEGYDNDPVYSPDGKYLVYHSMKRASFESDRNRIMLVDRSTGARKDLTAGLDQTAHGATWMPDSKALVFDSERNGTNQMFKIEIANGSTSQISKGQYNWHIMGFTPDGQTALTSRTSMIRPAELHSVSMADGSDQVLTDINGTVYESLELPTVEARYVDATDGKKIHCWVIYPPGFDKTKNEKWPLLTYCQGGPQGQIGQWFSYRWNFHLMAANGYVVVAPNRRGLPGFGRQWNDQISGDWGGQAMQDILSATDSMTAETYIDRKKVAAIGASFGGYTVYWLMGNHKKRFATMIAHCGVFNLESMYGSTEELFFVNWDLGGPYWKGGDVFDEYQQFSPHRFVQNWDTPLMVIHGEKDFRVPVTQGMEAFTAAQVLDIPSRFLYYPNEGHWVLQPQNGVLWHRVFFDWLGRYCKN